MTSDTQFRHAASGRMTDHGRPGQRRVLCPARWPSNDLTWVPDTYGRRSWTCSSTFRQAAPVVIRTKIASAIARRRPRGPPSRWPRGCSMGLPFCWVSAARTTCFGARWSPWSPPSGARSCTASADLRKSCCGCCGCPPLQACCFSWTPRRLLPASRRPISWRSRPALERTSRWKLVPFVQGTESSGCWRAAWTAAAFPARSSDPG
mmetsp:Transcript_68768/g.212655  ORF Transcript_68768/g.212655 Transcript_68768/m.212655 type:complete len:206 (+) Transcript_68768:6-623(+)